ncbi:DUF1793-domain-containing [Lecanosticta acicola]|uniref:DUF1793-domain-containing n=1 Tax=Lecanosticta acicola TaxID=111012 RepID=A0AAI8YY34_9PEZI|nr:DUF1793-domain-containing [Lecanosticta acicola]
MAARASMFRPFRYSIAILTLLRCLHGAASIIYSPARPPAVPLAVRSPYTSAWLSTSSIGALNSNSASFWTGVNVGWEGIITVDGVNYEYLGANWETLPNISSAIQTHLTYDSQWSNFTFTVGPVQLNACFFSPVLPQDLCRTSIPLSYLYITFQSQDDAAHDVKLYSDVDGYWLDGTGGPVLRWGLSPNCADMDWSAPSDNTDHVCSWMVGLDRPAVLNENADFAQWGNFSYSTAPGSASNFSVASGYSVHVRSQYLKNASLINSVDTNFRSASFRAPVFAFSHDFKSTRNASALYTVGTIQLPAVRYLSSGGLADLDPWWTKYYNDTYKMIDFHYADFATASAKGAAFERQLKDDVESYYKDNLALNASIPGAGRLRRQDITSTWRKSRDQFGQQYLFDVDGAYGFLDSKNFTGIAVPDVSEAHNYYAIVALSARQVMGAYTLTVPPPSAVKSGALNGSEPIMFQKEISSNGNVNTLDVLYPTMPFFLYANPQLLRYALDPVFLYMESGFYPNGWSIHDIGTKFPNATGHVAGDDEMMPVEVSSDIVIMALAYYKFSGDSAFLQKHYEKMQQWVGYLKDNALIPGNQLSTDDFAGRLTNQTNLAIKGIVALRAMSVISEVVNDTAAATEYKNTASEYYNDWESFGIDPSERHSVLQYQLRSSWGLLYNTYPDKLLNLGVIADEVYDMQSKWYPCVSQIFGVPLDSRGSWTKSDWQMWVAATCSPSTRRLFVNAIAYWLNTTAANVPFADLYDTVSYGNSPTISGSTVLFEARPVVGGHFSLLALLKAGENTDSGTGRSDGGFEIAGTDTVEAQVADYMTVSASDDSHLLDALATLTESVGRFNGVITTPPAHAPVNTDDGWTTTTMTLSARY